jgi:4'-phosphopantetheinyl transferase EntD
LPHQRSPSAIVDAVRQILSPGVIVEGGNLLEPCLADRIAEEVALPDAVDVRRREFRAGRFYARRALARLGLGSCTIPVGPGRAPIWPAGFTGSIAHTHDLCVAIVGPSARFRSIGFDMEDDEPLPDELTARVATAAELRASGDLESRLGSDVGKLLFVAKEAFYKMWFPLTGRFLEFHDVEIEVDADKDEIRAALVADAPAGTFKGRLARRENMIFGYFGLPAD